MKLKVTMDELDVEAISALKSLGSASEVLLNLKKIISHIKSGISEYKPEGTIVLPSSPFSSRNEISLSDSVEVKRNQAAVSPMVKGYVISNPTITLERLRLNDIGGVIEPGKSVDTRGELSPIPEENTESEPIRTRLGRRGQLPHQFTERAASKLNEFIPEAHAEPVVRLSDVSRLLSNTSWLNVNYTPTKDNTTYSSPSTSSAPSVSGINVFSTDTITLRERKKGKRANKVSGIDKIESSSGSSENLKIKDPKSGIMGTENNEDKSCEYKNPKAESLEPVNKEEKTIRFVNSGILVENSESRNSTLRSFTEINEVNASKYKNSRKRPNNEIAESSFIINNEGTSNKSSSFEESKFTINASVTVNEIEESVGRETIIQINRNSNEENFSKCKNSIVCSDIESTSKYVSNVLSDKGNDEKMSVSNIEASVEKMGENANNYSIEVTMSKFRNSKKLEYTGNPDMLSSTTANKEEISDEQSSESRSTFLLDNEIDSRSSTTFLVRNSNTPVSQEDSIINCTRLLPELGIATSNESERENTVIEQSSMNPTTSVKSSLLGVRELRRPRSTRIKKPSIKVLEAVSGDINEGSFQVKRNSNRANRVSQKNSKCVAESDASSANSLDSKTSEVGGPYKRTFSRMKKTVVYRDEPLTNVAESDASSANSLDTKTSEVGGTYKRTSSRIKKTVVYRDEPLTKEEMKKILLKGLRKGP